MRTIRYTQQVVVCTLGGVILVVWLFFYNYEQSDKTVRLDKALRVSKSDSVTSFPKSHESSETASDNQLSEWHLLAPDSLFDDQGSFEPTRLELLGVPIDAAMDFGAKVNNLTAAIQSFELDNSKIVSENGDSFIQVEPFAKEAKAVHKSLKTLADELFVGDKRSQLLIDKLGRSMFFNDSGISGKQISFREEANADGNGAVLSFSIEMHRPNMLYPNPTFISGYHLNKIALIRYKQLLERYVTIDVSN